MGGNDRGGFFSNSDPELVDGVGMGRTFAFGLLTDINMAPV